MWYVPLALLTIAGGMASAQQGTPELTWHGYLSDSAVLYIQGDRVDVQGRSTGAVDRPVSRFRSPLPAVEQEVTVEVRRGGGNVKVEERPAAQNAYTAVISIQPSSARRPEFYDLAVHWKPDQQKREPRKPRTSTRNRTADDKDRSGGMTWSGAVDGEALIVVSGDRATVRTVSGRRAMTEDTQFTSALPKSDTEVRLENVRGRGSVDLIEQPSAENSYSAVVEVLDEPEGAGRYSFRMIWETARSPQERPGVLTPSGAYVPPGAMRWSGRVDERVRITIRGRQASSFRLAGAATKNEQFTFGSGLPRGAVNADVRVIRGRGEANIVQQSNAQNGYQLLVEVRDPGAGADDYELEIRWR